MSPLVIASHNEGKVREIRELLVPLGITVISAATLKLPEPEENGATFEENAVIKSKSAQLLSGHTSLADDSGLCIPVLGGAPGIYSARWAAGDFTAAFARIEQECAVKNINATGQPAYFVCVLSLTDSDGHTENFEGSVHGHLVFPERGSKGFGYDPIFIPEGHSHTFGEMDPSAKHAISHRARAFEKFLAYVRKGREGKAL